MSAKPSTFYSERARGARQSLKPAPWLKGLPVEAFERLGCYDTDLGSYETPTRGMIRANKLQRRIARAVRRPKR